MIEINNLTTSEVEESFVKKIASQVLKGEKKEGNLSIAFIGSGRMRKLNKKYRKKNRVTDVLAFGDLNEIVICLREVKKNAKKFTPLEIPRAKKKHKENNRSLTGFNSSFEKELARVLIHGILHLLGYDHEKTEGGARKMEEKEKHYLEQIAKLLNC